REPPSHGVGPGEGRGRRQAGPRLVPAGADAPAMTRAGRPTWRAAAERLIDRVRRFPTYPVPVAPAGTVLSGATAVVTGAAGVLGSALVAALREGGSAVWALDRRPVATAER